MPEGPVGGQGGRAEPTWVLPDGADGSVPYPRFRGSFPRVVIKADLLPALSVLSTVALLGFPLGWIWAHLVPAQRGMATSSGEIVPVTTLESYHDFDGVAIFAVLALAIGVLVGAAIWMLRGRRGPVVMLGAVLGSLLASWLGIALGESFVSGLFPLPSPVRPGQLIDIAPTIDTWWVMVTQPLAVVLVYGFAASWNGMDDLGRRLS